MLVVRKPHRVRWKESPCRMLADVTVHDRVPTSNALPVEMFQWWRRLAVSTRALCTRIRCIPAQRLTPPSCRMIRETSDWYVSIRFFLACRDNLAVDQTCSNCKTLFSFPPFLSLLFQTSRNSTNIPLRNRFHLRLPQRFNCNYSFITSYSITEHFIWKMKRFLIIYSFQHDLSSIFFDFDTIFSKFSLCLYTTYF